MMYCQQDCSDDDDDQPYSNNGIKDRGQCL